MPCMSVICLLYGVHPWALHWAGPFACGPHGLCRVVFGARLALTWGLKELSCVEPLGGVGLDVHPP